MAFGQAAQALQIGCTSLNGATGTWTGMASSPTGKGFFVTLERKLRGAMTPCPLVGSPRPPWTGGGGDRGHTRRQGVLADRADGGVFSFGVTPSTGRWVEHTSTHPWWESPATPDGGGYWLTAADGGVFSFGDAWFYGSMGGTHLNAPVVGIRQHPTATGTGWRRRTAGFSFGSAPFEGSMAGTTMNAPVVGIATFDPPLPADRAGFPEVGSPLRP